MADISILSRLVNGAQRSVNLSTNTLVVDAVKFGGGAGTDLTKTILDKLINLQNGTDFANGTNSHTHDGRYFTESELASSSASSGSDLIGDDNTYSNFTPTAATVKGALAGINAALAAPSSVFSDSVFRIQDNADATKQIAFEASAITTGTTRTITMPDANVDLGNIANRTLSNLNAPTAINQDLLPDAHATRSIGAASNAFVTLYAYGVNAPNGTASISTNARRLYDSSATQSANYEDRTLLDSSGTALSINWQARKLHASNSAEMLNWSTAGVLNANSNKLTNVADPTAAQDAATKAYVDAVAQGLKPKQAVRVATLVAGTLATSFENGDVVDGITLVTGNRILIKNQAAPADNGIYTVNASGAPTRATDFDSLSPIDEVNGAYTFVQEGTQAGQGWVQQGTVATLGTDAINFVYFNSVTSITGGDMITVVGANISVDLATVSGLESSNPGNSAGQLRIKLEASNPSLRFTGSNELGIKFDSSGAVASGASGIAVQVDNSTIEISGNALRVKDAGIVLAKLASNSVDENKIVSTSFDSAGAITGGSGVKIKVEVDGTSLERNANALRIKSTAYDQLTITGGSGSAAAVAYAPQAARVLVAGEAFAANTSFLVRWAITGETAGRVYKADKDASTTDLFYAFGIALSTGAVSAGGNIKVINLGTHTLGSSDAAFGAGDVGKAVFLTTAGAFSVTAPTATNDAVVRIGIVQSTSSIDVAAQVVGIN